jgi:hypothetical protein
MTIGDERARRPPRIAALATAFVTIAVSGGACIIADPPSDLPVLPETRPTIMRGSVVPPASAVLGRWPAAGRFTVPVELVDPRVDIWWSAFVDYNPATGEGRVETSKSTYEPRSTQGRIRTLDVVISEPLADGCHVVEVVVALRFESDKQGEFAHTPEEPGGDSVTWFFSPTGDLSGCPVLDAGLTPLVGDAEAEGGGEMDGGDAEVEGGLP